MNKKNLKRFQISDIVHDFVMAQQEQIKDVQTALLPVREANQLKVIHSFQENRLASHDFHSSSGYGYGEGGEKRLTGSSRMSSRQKTAWYARRSHQAPMR